MEFRVLGPVAIAVGDRETVLGRTREGALVADLVAHAGEVLSTERLIEDVWRGAAPAGAAATLHAYVRNVRRVLEADGGEAGARQVLMTRRPGYRIDPERSDVDAWRCERLVREGRAALARGDARRASERLREGLAMWRGPAYGDLASESYLCAAAAELEELRLSAIEDRIEADLALGRHAELCGELETLVAEHPYRERPWAQLMVALYRSGRQADALRAYQRVRRRLQEDLGIEPAVRLRDLEAAILHQKPELDAGGTRSPGDSALATDVAAVARQLAARTTFVGRTDELKRIGSLLHASSPVRLVTIKGPGGAGKSRLALQAAMNAAASFSGAVVASLGSVTNPAAVADAVVTALGRMGPAASALDALAELARGDHRLVVLDNCEHVIDAAAACVEAIVSGGGAVLATSRQALGLPGEHVVPIDGLATDAAAILFEDRARAVDPEFQVDDSNRNTVEAICHRLDRLPLAIELAASRVRSLSVSDIADRLNARFRLLHDDGRGAVERHQTLRGAVQWSYDLLAPELQWLFDRLSVFAGGFLSDAVVSVCSDATMDDFDALDGLDSLVVRSMVMADPARPTTRYRLLDTLREFGAERLGASGEMDGCRARHAHHFLDVAEHARRQLSTAESTSAIDTFTDEWDNLRLAFDWFVRTNDVDGALRLVVATNWYAIEAFQFELYAWVEHALVLDGVADHELWPAAAAVTAMGRLNAGDALAARQLCDQAVAVERARGPARRWEPTSARWICERASGDLARLKATLPELEYLSAALDDVTDLEGARYLRVITHVTTGLDGLGSLVGDAVREAEQCGSPLQLACAYMCELAVALRNDRAAAPDLYAKIVRWAQLAHAPYQIANVALIMAAASRPEDPVETLTFARQGMAAHFDAGYWANFVPTLGPVVDALARLGRHRAATLLLGGLDRLRSGQRPSEGPLIEAEAHLTAALGADYQPLHDQGARLDRHQLARLALNEIDELLDPTIS